MLEAEQADRRTAQTGIQRFAGVCHGPVPQTGGINTFQERSFVIVCVQENQTVAVSGI